MKIGIVEIGEPLPLEKDARFHRSLKFAKYLASKGHNVTFWTSNFSHSQKIFLTDGDHTQQWENVSINYLRGIGYKKNISLRRYLHEKHFSKKLISYLKTDLDYDLFYIPVPTISAAYATASFCKKNDIPYVVDIVDRWPEAIFNLFPNYIRFFVKFLLASLIKKMSYICNNAAAIWGCSKSYLRYGKTFLEKGREVSNFVYYLGYEMLDEDPQLVNNARQNIIENGINQNDLNIFFVGTIGRFFNLKTVISAARKLSTKKNIKFIIAGDGSSLNYFKNLSRDLNNIVFLGWIDAPHIQACMELCSIGLAPYSENELFSMPNKPFEYMSGGLAIISSIQDELPEFLSEYKCGITYKHNDVDSLLDAIAYFENDKRLNEAQLSSLELFNKRFKSSLVNRDAENELKKIV